MYVAYRTPVVPIEETAWLGYDLGIRDEQCKRGHSLGGLHSNLETLIFIADSKRIDGRQMKSSRCQYRYGRICDGVYIVP